MPKTIDIWQRKEADPGYVICDDCKGWGGEDRNSCYGFGASPGDHWMDCFTCYGSGQIDEEYAEYLKGSN